MDDENKSRSMEDSVENTGTMNKSKLIPFHGRFAKLTANDKWKNVQTEASEAASLYKCSHRRYYGESRG